MRSLSMLWGLGRARRMVGDEGDGIGNGHGGTVGDGEKEGGGEEDQAVGSVGGSIGCVGGCWGGGGGEWREGRGNEEGCGGRRCMGMTGSVIVAEDGSTRGD